MAGKQLDLCCFALCFLIAAKVKPYVKSSNVAMGEDQVLSIIIKGGN